MDVNSKKEHIYIIGAGFTGTIVARILAEKYNKKVLIIDKRNVVSGNMYDYKNKHGVLIQKYGIHVFHTNNDKVYNYLSRFTEWRKHHLNSLTHIKNKFVNVPFNFSCIDTFWSKNDARKLKKKLLNQFPNRNRVSVFELCESKDKDISEFGNFLFENDYKPYTCKQWGRKPEEIDKSILKRVQISLSYDNRYFSDKYQTMPADGFLKLFKNMLAHKNIKVKLSTDFFDMFSIKNNAIVYKGTHENVPVLYTGALDYLFRYKYGLLPYRTLIFKSKTFNQQKRFDAPFLVFPKHPTLTRMTEMKTITNIGPKNKTTIIYEYPKEYQKKDSDPYYPVLSDENISKYNKYKKEADKISNLFIAGRLADYKYYNMDDSIANAFAVAEKIAKKLK